MRRNLLATTVVTVFAFPAAAVAATGVVLSVDRHTHTIQLVNARHQVGAYHYRGKLPKVHTGSVVSFKRSGRTISHVKSRKQASHSASFLARIVRSSKHGVVVRLADGKLLHFSASQVVHKRGTHRRHGVRTLAGVAGAAGITVNIQGLQPGVTVMITETVDPNGNVTITITLPTSGVGGEQTASGFVSELDSDAFVVQTNDGSELRLHMAQATLAAQNLSVCDDVEVTYHQDAGMLIADSVKDNGASSAGDCSSGDGQDVTGTISAVSPDSISINSPGHGTMTFAVDDPSITDGFLVGDVVDVTYSDAGNGTLDASDVEYVEQDVTGTVTSVSGGSVTLSDDSTGQPVTITADPTLGMFDGVSFGDQLDVTYHQAASGLVADAVDDSSTD